MSAAQARRLRVLFVIDSLGSGGAQRQIVLLALGLAARGHAPAFQVYYPEHDYFEAELAAAGIEVMHAPKSSRYSLEPVIALRRLLRRRPFDAVVAYLPTPSIYAELATRFRGRPPLVVSERSAFVTERPTLQVHLRSHLHRFADAVVVNSHHHRKAMRREFPWLKPRLQTIWNGVDLERFAPGDGPRSGDLVAVGSIRPLKNALGLARALTLLHEGGRSVPRVWWAGKMEPVPESAEERRAVDGVLDAAGLRDRWVWMGEHRDVPGLLRSHAALVHPSLLEGLSNAVCEALASGTPVLAGDVGDQGALVQEGVTGLLFDSASPAAMAETIDRFSRLAPASRGAMQVAARDFAEQALSVDRTCDEYEALLLRLAAPRRGSKSPSESPAEGERVRQGRSTRHLSSLASY